MSNHRVELALGIQVYEKPDYTIRLRDEVTELEADFSGYIYTSETSTWEWFFKTQELANSVFAKLKIFIEKYEFTLADSLNNVQRGTAWLAQD